MNKKDIIEVKKFDGIEVKTYRHDILDETALSSSIIHDLMIDKVGPVSYTHLTLPTKA